MIVPFAGKHPRVGAGAFIAPTAAVVGDVEIGPRSSIWFGAVLRGDDHFIRIGAETNIQDNVVIHEGQGERPAVIGDQATIGHSVTLHGCTIGNLCLIGMGAILLDGCEVGERSLIGAGSLLLEGTKIPPGTLAAGAPARVKRDLRPEEIAHLTRSAADYMALAARYLVEPWVVSLQK